MKTSFKASEREGEKEEEGASGDCGWEGERVGEPLLGAGPGVCKCQGAGAGGAVHAGHGGNTAGENPPGDELLIERICSGEQSALGELWRRYMGLLFSQILRVLQNSSEAEDVAVEVFLEVWKRAKSYHPDRAKPAAWLVTLARRRAIDRLRERTSYERARNGLALECAAARTVCAGGQGESARLEGLRVVLEQAMNGLPLEQRTTVLKVFFEGLSQREISRRTGVPVGTVKTRLELGLRKLRDRLLWRRSRHLGAFQDDFTGSPSPAEVWEKGGGGV